MKMLGFKKNKIPYEFEIKKSPSIRVLPGLKDLTSVRYPLIMPFASAHVLWSEDFKEYVYEVEEPILNKKEKEILEMLRQNLTEKLSINVALEAKNPIDQLQKQLKSVILELRLDKNIDEKGFKKFAYYVYRDFFGLNRIEPLLHDVYVEDIECNGVNEPLYVVHRVYGNLRTNLIYKDSEELGDFIEKLAQKAGHYVSFANPLLDGALPDGSRVNATYSSDVTTSGPTFTIRKFNKDPLTPIDLINNGSGSAEIFAYLWMVVEHRLNIMIIGETAAGKTTLLNTIANFIPTSARVCSIEDTREINIAHSNWLPSVARAGFGSMGLGEITLFDLLKESFRQNPDYVIVGEARGKEAYVMFQGMASGHPTMATFHAENVEALVKRLENPPINLPGDFVQVMDLVVKADHFKSSSDAYRKITMLAEIEKNSKKDVDYNMYFDAEKKQPYSEKSYVLKRIAKKSGMKEKDIRKELDKRKRLLQGLVDSGMRGYMRFSGIVSDFYKNPEKVLSDWGVKDGKTSKSKKA